MTKSMPRLLFLFSFFVICVSGYAQNGFIRGSIIDDATGEALIGATAQIEGTSTGGVADIDGKFSVNEVTPGTYAVIVSYVGYQTQRIESVVVPSGGVVVLDVRLKSDVVGLEEVVVTAEAIKNNEIALLTLQKKSGLVLDGISARQFSLNGDSDAASAIKRVTGVSVEGGKYVYVRGLGDRYSKTTLNGAEVPGLDPNRNTVQMDLFPSNLIDNIVVYKTFSPDIPANFTGGYVDVATKDFPDAFTLQIGAGFGYNTNATFTKNVLTDDWGNSHWLGFASSDRDLPAIVADGVSQREQPQQLDRETKSFNGSFDPSTYTPSVNHGFSVSMGNQKEIFGKQVGFIGSLSYQRSYNYYDNAAVGRFFLPGDVTAPTLDTLRDLTAARSNESILWGALFNSTIKFNPNNKVSLNLMRNQSADADAGFYEGLFPFASGDDPNFFYQARAITYTERSLSNGQLRGEHVIGSNKNKFFWMGSYSRSTQDEPDLKFFQNLRFGQGPEYTYDAVSNNLILPSRYFRDMEETNTDLKMNLEIPIQTSKLKFGVSYVRKERDFYETIIQFNDEPFTTLYAGDVDAYFADSNLGIVSGSVNNPQFGLIIQDNTTGGGTYFGEENVPGAFAMIDWQLSKTLKAIIGARYERTDISVDNVNAAPAERFANVENDDILPAINVTKNLNDKTNLRFAYGRTVARPTFRELARFASFDFIGDFILIGNPFLKRTTIDNVDLRYEIFPNSGELISVSAFYKNFQDPIERAVDPNTNDISTQVVFRNVDEAFLIGGEFELRKKLSFLSPQLSKFMIGVNVAYIYSRVDISPGELALIRVNDPDADDQRVMFGQSPYIINALFSYDDPDRNFNVNLNYNVQGERLSVVSTGGIPNIYEQPRPLLDLNIKKGIGERFSIRVAATNLLNSRYRQIHDFQGVEYDYSNFRVGQSFSLGFSYLVE